jgi:hypothetical protein
VKLYNPGTAEQIHRGEAENHQCNKPSNCKEETERNKRRTFKTTRKIN